MFFTQGNLTRSSLRTSVLSLWDKSHKIGYLVSQPPGDWIGKRIDSGIQIIVRTAVDTLDIVRLGIVVWGRSVHKL